MFRNKKLMTTGILAAIVFGGVAAINPPGKQERNLKILPKDISDEKLDSIMQTYNVALGVKCQFCHVPVKEYPDSLNFASDAEPMKENARNMMRMVIEINKNNFWFDKSQQPVYLKTVVCFTCHRGEAFPPEH